MLNRLNQIGARLRGVSPSDDDANAPGGLLILDDIFPHLLSAFRIAEFNGYLNAFADARIVSSGSAFKIINERRSFAAVCAEYLQQFPQYKDRFRQYQGGRLPPSRLAYLIFLNNAVTYLDEIERARIPFIFTLYPGGGFKLDNATSDKMLSRLRASPYFRKVLVTQKPILDYVLQRGFFTAEQVEFIYGGVLPTDRLVDDKSPLLGYGRDKNTLDICFVANKYMPRGVDKGYDVFIATAQALTRQFSDVFFHVIGSFDATDIDVSDIGDRIKFYGVRHTEFLSTFYPRMDMILSPNVPFVLGPGSFDGFPIGGCVEAALSGVAVLCTDHLKQNLHFVDREHLVLISREVTEICRLIDIYHDNPSMLLTLRGNGRRQFWKVFSKETQMDARLRLLTPFLASTHPKPVDGLH